MKSEVKNRKSYISSVQKEEGTQIEADVVSLFKILPK